MFKKKIALTLALVMVLSFSTTVSVDAVANSTVGITGGELSVTDLGGFTFTDVILDGTTQYSTGTIAPIIVNDARGSNLGWNLTIQATPFAAVPTGAPAVSTLPDGSLKLQSPSIVGLSYNSEVSGITSTPSAYTIDALVPTAVKIASVPVSGPTNEGMGKYQIDLGKMILTLKPGEIRAATYTSTITITLATGPGA